MIFEIFMEWFKRFIYNCNCIGIIIYISEYYIIQIDDLLLSVRLQPL